MTKKKQKSTAHHGVRVVHYNPRTEWLRRLFVLFSLVGVGVGAALAGWYLGQDMQIELIGERRELLRTVAEQREQIAELRHQVAVLGRGNEVERQANEVVRREVRVLNEKIYGLEKEITFYRNIMSPNAAADGLRIQRFDMAATRTPGQVRYKLVLTQVTEKRDLIQGKVQFELVGRQGQKRRTLVLDDTETGEDIRFRFRYFQELQGEFAVPAGFQPETIRVKARSSGRKPVEVGREFTWLVQEIGTDVRKG